MFNSRTDGFDRWAEYEKLEYEHDFVENRYKSDIMLHNFKQGVDSLKGLDIYI